MEIIEAIVYIIAFFTIWGSVCGLAWLIDTLLHKSFGRGIFPRGYWE